MKEFKTNDIINVYQLLERRVKVKEFLKYIPGFRSDKKWKKIIASIYYLFTLLMLVAGIDAFLFFFALPFIVFSIVDLVKAKKNNKSMKAAAIMLIISLIVAGGSINNIDAVENNVPEVEEIDKVEEVKEDLDEEEKSLAAVVKKEKSEETEKEKKEKIEEPKKESFEEVGNLKVHYINVGQGDAIFIELPNGENALIDGGPRSSGQTVLNYLNEQKVKKIDYLVATHPHEDHIGGLVGVINNYDIGKIYMPDVAHTTKTFENLLLAIQNKGNKITKAKAGEAILDKEGLSLYILAPEESVSGDNLNNYSVVLKLDYKNNSFLFTGDAESESEGIMIGRGYDLKADVLKVGHHGSSTSTTNEFLNKVEPKYAVISCGKDNKYGHPHQEIITKLNNKNIEIYRTDLDGTIIATSDGENINFNKKPTEIIGTAAAVGSSSGEKNSSNTETEAPVTDNVEEVYITNTGTKYHRSSCSSLSKSKIPISLKEAKNQGYEPCKRCSPPR